MFVFPKLSSYVVVSVVYVLSWKMDVNTEVFNLVSARVYSIKKSFLLLCLLLFNKAIFVICSAKVALKCLTLKSFGVVNLTPPLPISEALFCDFYYYHKSHRPSNRSKDMKIFFSGFNYFHQFFGFFYISLL